MAQMWIMDIVEEDKFLEDRRKLLRARAGVSERDVRRAASWFCGLERGSLLERCLNLIALCPVQLK